MLNDKVFGIVDYRFAQRVLLSRSSYGVYGLLLLSATLLMLKSIGKQVLIPDSIIILYPVAWIVPVFFSSYMLTSSRFSSTAWSRFTFSVNTIGGALWFGAVFRSVDLFSSIAIMSLMSGLYVMFGTLNRWQIMLYWFFFVVGEALAMAVHGQQLVIEDSIIPLSLAVHLYWSSLTSDFIRRQITKNKELMRRLRKDNHVIRKEQELVRERTQEVENERRKTEDLLLNILPLKTANELKTYGRAEPKTYGMVTVLFTDFKDFTSVSEQISPELLVREIDDCFSAFDEIMERHHVEKIKTVGDAYIAVAGLPEPTFTHAQDAVRAALDIRDFMLQRMEQKTVKGEITFEIRIGIHTGPVVAGIVGKKKFAYDIWGDTVNLAARMEQNSEAGKINISGATYNLVKSAFTCQHRGKIQAKNKGDVDMYFVELG